MPRQLPRVPNDDVEIVKEASRHLSHDWRRFFLNLIDALLNRIPVTGSATFAAATSVAVTFATAEANANYKVFIEAVANRTYWVTSKATSGFTINASASNSDTVGWQLIRA